MDSVYCCAGAAAAANVDSENKKELTHEKTVIMIAHRLKAVRHADQILVVEIKDKSSNKEHLINLMELDGIYRRFISGRKQAAGWKLQNPSLPHA